MSQNYHFDDPYLDRIWGKVAVLRERLVQEQIELGFSVKKHGPEQEVGDCS